MSIEQGLGNPAQYSYWLWFNEVGGIDLAQIHVCQSDHQENSIQPRFIWMLGEKYFRISKKEYNVMVNTTQFKSSLLWSMSTENYYTRKSPGYQHDHKHASK